MLEVVAITCGPAIPGPEDSSFEDAAASDDGISDSLRSKASSTSLASVAVRLFLALSASTRPSCGEISRNDVPKLGQQLLAQCGRLLGIEDDGAFQLSAATTSMSVTRRSRRHPRLMVYGLERALGR
jgi:hypothetical protein